MSAPERKIAATVTRGAVRCSAWLGVAGLGMIALGLKIVSARLSDLLLKAGLRAASNKLARIRGVLSTMESRTQVTCLRLMYRVDLPLRETLVILLDLHVLLHWPIPASLRLPLYRQRLSHRLSAGLDRSRVDRTVRALNEASERLGVSMW